MTILSSNNDTQKCFPILFLHCLNLILPPHPLYKFKSTKNTFCSLKQFGHVLLILICFIFVN